MRSSVSAFLCASHVAASCTAGTCDSDTSSLLQARALIRKSNKQISDADSLLQTVKNIADSLTQDVDSTTTPEDVNAAIGQAHAALETMLPEFADQHAHAQQEIAHALGAVAACHTAHGGELRVRLEHGVARDLDAKEQCEEDLHAAVEAEHEVCEGQGENPNCLCNEARTAITDQTVLCESVRETYETAFCDHQSVCSLLQECHSAAASVYDELTSDLEAAMISRQQQYRTVRQAECITTLITTAMLTSTPIPHASLLACNDASIDDLVLTFPEIPQPQTCPESQDEDPECDGGRPARRPPHGEMVVFDQADSALTVEPGLLSGVGQLGWASTANSAHEVTAHENICGISFKCSTETAHVMVGLASSEVTDWRHLDHGVTCRGAWSTNTDIYENGAHKMSLGGRTRNGRPTEEVHAIRVNQNGQVEYSLDGVVYLTSSRAVTYPWHVGVSAYTSPTLTEVQYLQCHEEAAPSAPHEDVVFDQSSSSLTVEPGSVTGAGQLNWNNPANSGRQVREDDDICGISFKCNTATGHSMIGLAHDFVGEWRNIDYAVTCRGAWSANTDIYERGTHRLSLGGRPANSRPTENVHAIRINQNGQVEYSVDAVVYYTSPAAVRYPWHVGLDAFTAPSLSEVQYLPCNEPLQQLAHDDDVMFDSAHSALTVSPGSVSGAGQLSWNTPANSARQVSAHDGICGISFKCNTAAGHSMIGLAHHNVHVWSNLDYAVTCRGAWSVNTDIYENGAHRLSQGGRPGNGNPTQDVHAIQINQNGQVEYSIGGSVYHTSSRAVTYPWHVGLDTFTAPSLSEVQYIRC